MSLFYNIFPVITFLSMSHAYRKFESRLQKIGIFAIGDIIQNPRWSHHLETCFIHWFLEVPLIQLRWCVPFQIDLNKIYLLIIIEIRSYRIPRSQVSMPHGMVNKSDSTIILDIFFRKCWGMEIEVLSLQSNLMDLVILRLLMPIWMVTHEDIQKILWNTFPRAEIMLMDGSAFSFIATTEIVFPKVRA